MTTFHMETDSAQSVASQLAQTAEALRTQSQSLNGSAQSINWVGPSRDEFMMEVEGLIRQLESQAEAGTILAGRVDNEVAEWENVANNFSSDTSQAMAFSDNINKALLSPGFILQHFFAQNPAYVTHTVADQAPKNMQELAKAVINLYGTGTPIRVMPIGENEYLIMVAGTEGGSQSNNWNSAISAGRGLKNDYQDLLKSILLSLPAGAVVNLAGHSQGGLISNSLAADDDVKNHLKVKSVTTFGSGVNAEPRHEVNYKRYTAIGDVVPLLSSSQALDVLTADNPFEMVKEAMELKQEFTIGIDQFLHLPISPLNPLGSSIWDSVKSFHFAYTDPTSNLKNQALTFDVKQWGSSDYYYSKHSSGQIRGLDSKLF